MKIYITVIIPSILLLASCSINNGFLDKNKSPNKLRISQQCRLHGNPIEIHSYPTLAK